MNRFKEPGEMAKVVDNSLRKSCRIKAPGAFRTISEVASSLDVPQHVLRFWESKFKQVKPLKRGGGRRYYRPADIDLLRGIRHLLYSDGYTIKGVQKLLREIGPKSIIESVRNSSDGIVSSVGGASTREMLRTGGSFIRENASSTRSVDPALKGMRTSKVEDTKDVQSSTLTSLQRDKLEELMLELDSLRDILRESGKV